MFQPILVLLISTFSLSGFSSDIAEETHPVLCQKIRIEANHVCRGNKSCYTHEIARLVDLYNSQITWDSQQTEMFCHY